MTDARFRPTTPETARYLADRLRVLDQAEVWLITGDEPYPALVRSIADSVEAHEAWLGDQLLCVFGVGATGLMAPHGVPWMLATDAFDRHPTVVGRWSVRWIAQLKTRYARLHNYVWADHRTSIPWLEWLGFELGPREPRGPYGKDFRRFEMKGSLVLV